LKNLKANKLIRRDVYDTFLPTVEYTITPHGLSLEKVLGEHHFWGLAYRESDRKVDNFPKKHLHFVTGNEFI